MELRIQRGGLRAALLLLALLLPLGVDFLHLHDHRQAETARVEVDFGLEDGHDHGCGPEHIHSGRTLDIDSCAACITPRSRATTAVAASVRVASTPGRTRPAAANAHRGLVPYRLSPSRAPPLSLV